MIRMSLSGAIASILGKADHEEYRDVGQYMKVKDLQVLLGLTATPMLYNYLSGKTKTIEPERALVIFTTFDILIDHWLTSDELQIEATNREISAQIAREPIKEIINAIVEIEQASTFEDMKRELRKIIARWY